MHTYIQKYSRIYPQHVPLSVGQRQAPHRFEITDIYRHMYISYIHTKHVYVYMYLHANVHVYVYTQTYIHVSTYIFIHDAYTYVYTHAHVYT